MSEHNVGSFVTLERDADGTAFPAPLEIPPGWAVVGSAPWDIGSADSPECVNAMAHASGWVLRVEARSILPVGDFDGVRPSRTVHHCSVIARAPNGAESMRWATLARVMCDLDIMLGGTGRAGVRRVG